MHTNKKSFCRLSSLSLPIHLPLRISHHFCFPVLLRRWVRQVRSGRLTCRAPLPLRFGLRPLCLLPSGWFMHFLAPRFRNRQAHAVAGSLFPHCARLRGRAVHCPCCCCCCLRCFALCLSLAPTVQKATFLQLLDCRTHGACLCLSGRVSVAFPLPRSLARQKISYASLIGDPEPFCSPRAFFYFLLVWSLFFQVFTSDSSAHPPRSLFASFTFSFLEFFSSFSWLRRQLHSVAG